MKKTKFFWITCLAIYLSFFAWYTNLQGPLTEEVSSYLYYFESLNAPQDQMDLIRKFLEADTGDDFLMANLVVMKDKPDRIGDVHF